MRVRLFDVAKDQTGAALVEFTIVLPVLMALILGLAQFGMIFYNYILVTNAAATGARQLSISRWDSTPYTDTVSAIENAAGSLALSACVGATPSCITLSVNGTACASDSSCSTATNGLQNAPLPSSNTTTPWPSSVTVQYPCTNNSIMPTSLISLTGICPLRSTMQQLVQ
jgi:Flp pilus assembly protein TadG